MFCRNTFYKDGRWRWPRIVMAVIGGFILMVVFASLFGFVVQALWNWIMTGIFNLREITYFEAFGLILLGRLLFGHFGGKAGGHGHRHHGYMGHGHKHADCDRSNYKDWRYYNEWWNAEGKETFKKYSENKELKDSK